MWDWPFIVYAGTVWLNRSEEDVMQMTPRKFYSLLTVHYDIKRLENGSNKSNTNWRTNGIHEAPTGYIDMIPGF
jgi:hypothetical protein